MASIFSRIVNGEIPSHKIYEDDYYLAFLDISPLTMGHTLLIPKKEIDYLFDINTTEYLKLMEIAKTVSEVIKKVCACKRVGMAVIGLEVPHAHIHLIPINSMDDMNFSRPKLNPGNEKLSEMAAKLRNGFN
jgi:histidine triad (HIT) family protein